MEQVEIRVKGRIDDHWSEWFDGFEITYPGEDESVLSGAIRDQTALYSILSRLRDLGLALVSVNTIEAKDIQISPKKGSKVD